MNPKVTLRKSLADPALLGNVLKGDSWKPWRVLLIAAMGEPLDDDERQVFKEPTQRDHEPGVRVEELAAVIGRRGGKSRASATLAVYLATLCDYTDVLAPGERGIALCIAPDQRQATIVLNYAAAAIEQSPILKQLIASRTSDSIELTNSISIEVRAASFRRLRGPTYIAVIGDESAFWYSDEFSANTDAEILNAVRPGLATTKGPLIIASSPYARRGVLWTTYKNHFGPKGDPSILVAQGPSHILNSSLPQSVVDRALERDRASASAEYLAMFRADIEFFVPIETVERCIGDYVELLPTNKHRYTAFCDPSGGSSDSFTLAISHREGKQIFIDAIREVQPPFSPEQVINDYATLLKSYRITQVRGDRYAGEFPRELFRKHSIHYRTAEKSKSDLYRDLLPLLNSRTICLPDSSGLISQLTNLERRTARGGRDSIDHAPGAHDDLANAVAGAVDAVGNPRGAAAGYWCFQTHKFVALGSKEDNGGMAVVNPQSQPDTARHPEPEPLDERWFKRIPTLRIW